MITGVVTANHEAIITIAVRNSEGREEAFEAVIDTGFSGSVTLPTFLIASWQLPWGHRDRAELGDGSMSYFDVHEAEVLWDGRWIAVEVQAVDAAPLVGMALLAGFELRMQVRPGGGVTIDAIPG